MKRKFESQIWKLRFELKFSKEIKFDFDENLDDLISILSKLNENSY